MPEPVVTTDSSYSISSQSVLLDDFLFTDKVVVDDSKTNQVAPFYGPDQTLQALSIIGDDTRSLVHVRQVSNVAGGWTGREQLTDLG